MPRATTAAWLVMPPRAVTMPRAACMPWMSSGLVSSRTRMTASPSWASRSASSASKTILPVAAPGLARQARGDDIARRVRVERRVQQLVQRRRLDPRHRLLLGDHALVGQIDGDLQRRLGGALAVAGLQHPEPALLDRELDVLHVAVVALQPLDDVDELGEDDRHGLFHRGGGLAHLLAARLGQRLGRADAGDDVLALGVDQELAVQLRLAGRRVAGEGDAGGARCRPCCRTPSTGH